MHCRFVAAGILTFLSFSSAASAGECAGNPDALGTSRVISLDPSELKQVGTIQYKQTLPLEDHEVVLTFDDGPIPPHTDKVLDALAAECVKATFFVVGEMATAHPAALQRAYREGHTIGTHTEHHARLDRLSADKAQRRFPTDWPPPRKPSAIRMRSRLSSVFPISIRRAQLKNGQCIWA